MVVKNAGAGVASPTPHYGWMLRKIEIANGDDAAGVVDTWA